MLETTIPRMNQWYGNRSTGDFIRHDGAVEENIRICVPTIETEGNLLTVLEIKNVE